MAMMTRPPCVRCVRSAKWLVITDQPTPGDGYLVCNEHKPTKGTAEPWRLK